MLPMLSGPEVVVTFTFTGILSTAKLSTPIINKNKYEQSGEVLDTFLALSYGIRPGGQSSADTFGPSRCTMFRLIGSSARTGTWDSVTRGISKASA